MTNVLEFTGITKADIPPEKVLSRAIDQGLADCLVIGRTKDGDLYFAGSMADGGAVLWLMELAKKDLLG